ncbi:MAG: hypothetical protein NC242_12900 [Roseburia sp.]|nr:hypothetical protein [Roseburia sp.]
MKRRGHEGMVKVIGYYNVRFYLYLRDERERHCFSCLEARVSAGERMLMKDIYGWCAGHGIRCRARFFYRPDFPVMANIWNFYSYLRGRIDMARIGRGSADV